MVNFIESLMRLKEIMKINASVIMQENKML